MSKFGYLLVYLLPLTVYVSFNSNGWLSFLPLFVFFMGVPLLELLLQPNHQNMDPLKAAEEKKNSFYDWVLYLAVPVQWTMLASFLYVIELTPAFTLEFYGKIFSMGMMCGVMGINIGHELGHRPERFEQFLGELLLLSSLNTHFLPYHNEGHHREVATPQDAATARENEWVFSFWIRSHFVSYAKAWSIEAKRMKKQQRSFWSLQNRMILYSIASLALLGSIFFFFNTKVLLAFIAASVIGILLLETVNYIEHYALLRKINDKGRYERVQHHHSWNSDHMIGRLMLFNLSRHSDHHYKASKKYQVLESLPESPQMPTGYPGMMVLALIPPLWFLVMNRKLRTKA